MSRRILFIHDTHRMWERDHHQSAACVFGYSSNLRRRTRTSCPTRHKHTHAQTQDEQSPTMSSTLSSTTMAYIHTTTLHTYLHVRLAGWWIPGDCGRWHHRRTHVQCVIDFQHRWPRAVRARRLLPGRRVQVIITQGDAYAKTTNTNKQRDIVRKARIDMPDRWR